MSENEPSVYEHWRRKFGYVTGLGLTEDEQQERDLSFKNKKCHEWKRDLLGTSNCLALISYRFYSTAEPQAPRSFSCYNTSMDWVSMSLLRAFTVSRATVQAWLILPQATSSSAKGDISTGVIWRMP
jgi:hypothetical protein